MTNHSWNWAQLSEDQLRLLSTAEESLGADILLAFQPGGDTDSSDRQLPGLQAADLDESQLECLRGTEDMLDAVVVAYQQTDS